MMSTEDLALDMMVKYTINRETGRYADIEVVHDKSKDPIHIWTTDTDVNVDAMLNFMSSIHDGHINGSKVRVSEFPMILDFDSRTDTTGGFHSMELKKRISMITDPYEKEAYDGFMTLFDQHYVNTGTAEDYKTWLNIVLTAVEAIHRHEERPNDIQAIFLGQADDMLTTRSKTRLVEAMKWLCPRINGIMIMSTMDPYVISDIHRTSVHVFHENGVNYDDDDHRIGDSIERSITVYEPSIETYHEDISIISSKVLGLRRLDSGPER